jgi:hypothetical protein
VTHSSDKIPFSKLLTAEISSKLSCLCIIFNGILCTKNFWNHVDSKQKCPKSSCNSFATGGRTSWWQISKFRIITLDTNRWTFRWCIGHRRNFHG